MTPIQSHVAGSLAFLAVLSLQLAFAYAADPPLDLPHIHIDPPRFDEESHHDHSERVDEPLDARQPTMRQAFVRNLNEYNKSEAAIHAALRWLNDHQMADGDWSFEHGSGACQYRCGNAGSFSKARNAATALALLPFLGAGLTPAEGNYQKQTAAGLSFLVSNMKFEQEVGSFDEPGGGPYSQAWATLAVCEAYTMTRDRALRQPAQAAINQIMLTQDAESGGWRYKAGQPCNLGLTGWQIMALRSGCIAQLNVSEKTVRNAIRFLNATQDVSGGTYGYTAPGNDPTATAIAVLCRMHLGWKREHPQLQAGVQRLAELGPSKNNLLYDFFAQQVMRDYGEPFFQNWNRTLRDDLLHSQCNAGHEQGSWYLAADEPACRWGGRLYCTAMAAMTLEVYYRHMPIYRHREIRSLGSFESK